MNEYPTYNLLIDGQSIKTDRFIDVINPATGEVFAKASRADEALLNRAVAAAKAAFPAWSSRPIAERSQLLLKLADAIEARAPEFAQLLTQEQGKPMEQAMGEIFGTAFMLRGFAAMTLEPKVLKEEGKAKIIEHRTPLGVVATITPWNYPVMLLSIKLAPALIAGNTVVIKPPPTTPLTICLLGDIFREILPPGVVNIICDMNDLGGLLTSHPDVAKVGFTGSTATGKKVMAAAADTIKRLTLELGGNDAAIVLDDVDPVEAAAHVFNAAMFNSGQICFAAKRAYVPRAMYDVFCDELARLAKAAVVGNGMEPGTQIGPIQNAAQFERLKGFLADAHARGKVIAGGAPLDRPGYFIPPTIVRDVPDDARIVVEEQFGPILPVLAYDDIDDAIKRANSLEYGLCCTIWGRDLDRATAIAMRIEAGTVWINQHMALDINVSLRGTKQSGFGADLGEEGLHDYTQARVVNRIEFAPRKQG